MAIGSMTTNSTVDMIDKTLSIENAPADAAATGAAIAKCKADTLLAAYPVGSLYMSAEAASPASIVGGTWEQIKDKFILAAGDTYAAGSTGGEATHTHDYSLIYNALYGAIVGTDENLIRSFDYATSTYKNSHNITYTSEIKKNKGIMGDYEDAINISLMRNDAKTNTASTIPPYVAMYVWKRIA